jgi:hypothetical protein
MSSCRIPPTPLPLLLRRSRSCGCPLASRVYALATRHAAVTSRPPRTAACPAAGAWGRLWGTYGGSSPSPWPWVASAPSAMARTRRAVWVCLRCASTRVRSSVPAPCSARLPARSISAAKSPRACPTVPTTAPSAGAAATALPASVPVAVPAVFVSMLYYVLSVPCPLAPCPYPSLPYLPCPPCSPSQPPSRPRCWAWGPALVYSGLRPLPCTRRTIPVMYTPLPYRLRYGSRSSAALPAVRRLLVCPLGQGLGLGCRCWAWGWAWRGRGEVGGRLPVAPSPLRYLRSTYASPSLRSLAAVLLYRCYPGSPAPMLGAGLACVLGSPSVPRYLGR